MTGRKFLQKKQQLNERKKKNYSSNALKGLFVLMAIDSSYEFYCNILLHFYGNPNYLSAHMRGWIAITFNVLFKIAYIVTADYIAKNAINVKLKVVLNPENLEIKGLTLLLWPLSEFIITISIVAIMYDVYEIIFVHLLGVAL